MTTEVIRAEFLQEAFRATVLLTGSLKRAEAAVLEGIRLWNNEAAPDFLQKAATAAVERSLNAISHAEDLTETFGYLPVELQRILRLPASLRRCYVLRILMELPSSKCSMLLGVDPHAVNRNACRAAQILARIVQPEVEGEEDPSAKLSLVTVRSRRLEPPHLCE
jgi:hypothetical protein